MSQYGKASVVGVDGTVAYNGASAIAAFLNSIEAEQRAKIDEFMSGLGELIGFRKSDERIYLDLIIIPASTSFGAGALDQAFKALVFPTSPSKVTLANMPDSSTVDIQHNGDYIYFQGARRTIVEGRAALRMVVFQPKTSPVTVGNLLTLAS